MPVIASIDCNYYMIIGNADGAAMWRSSDGTDAHGYIMPANTGWYSLIVPPLRGIKSMRPVRFPKDSIVTFLKAVSGTGPAIVEFIL